jgi:SAM-dependent methyltransferase
MAASYNRRYDSNNYSGVEQAVAEFVEGPPAQHYRVVEVGCGTGHWVRRLRESKVAVSGLDPSAAMLQIARESVAGRVIRARAEALPYANASVDRLFCVNALHHFSDPAAFSLEARRVLRKDGGVLTIGLDPHTRQDSWWVYDYFPSALTEDRRRYLPAHRIRELLSAAGFAECETRLAQHLPREMSVSEARAGGFLERTGKSQLMVISDSEYEDGLQRINAAGSDDDAKILRSDLRLFATVGWVRS